MRPDAQKQVSAAFGPQRLGPTIRGREKLPEHLERREEILPCCPEDCQCAKVRCPASGDWL